MTLIIPDFARKESIQRGCTEAGWCAGIRLLQMAYDGDERAEFEPVASIQPEFDRFYPWYRIKAKKSGVRVIAEVRTDTQTVVLIAVLPRSIVYDDVVPLWKKYRTRRPS